MLGAPCPLSQLTFPKRNVCPRSVNDNLAWIKLSMAEEKLVTGQSKIELLPIGWTVSGVG